MKAVCIKHEVIITKSEDTFFITSAAPNGISFFRIHQPDMHRVKSFEAEFLTDSNDSIGIFDFDINKDIGQFGNKLSCKIKLKNKLALSFRIIEHYVDAEQVRVTELIHDDDPLAAVVPIEDFEQKLSRLEKRFDEMEIELELAEYDLIKQRNSYEEKIMEKDETIRELERMLATYKISRSTVRDKKWISLGAEE
jgi:hypothetical protein